MPCIPFVSSNGQVVGIMCYRNKSSQKCHVCGKPSIALCDATRKDGKMCNAPMCEEHRHRVAEDTDVCHYHNKPKYIKTAIENRKKMESTTIKKG